MKTSEKTDKILPKLFALKQKLQPVAKSAENPYFNSTYADLNAHIDAVEPLAQELKLYVSAAPMRDITTSVSYVETRITDVESGQWVAGELNLVLSKQDPQAVGSAVTYFRRYSLNALLNMKAVDDDGNAATFGQSKPAGKPATKSAAGSPATAEPTPAQTTTSAPAAKRSSFRTKKAVNGAAKTEAPVVNAQVGTGDGEWQ